MTTTQAPLPPSKLLIVEDEERLAVLLERSLTGEGFDVERCSDGAKGLEQLLTRRFSLCVLDGRLPSLDGLDVVAQARAQGVRTAILMLTARDSIESRVSGLESGADDYLTKPFALAELCARLRALARRAMPARTTLTCRDLVLDEIAHTVARGGVEVALSAKERGLLALLLKSRPDVVSRAMVLRDVFGYAFDPGTNIVDVHVRHLRQKIDRDGERSLIETVRGVGYRVSAT